MIRTLRAALGGVVLVAAAMPAAAAAPTWSYFEASYLSSRTDNSNLDADGFRLGGSLSLMRWLYGTVEYDTRSFDGTDSDLAFGTAGVGVHSLKRAYQFFAVLSYERTDLASGAGDVNDDGYGLQFGVRVPIRMFAVQADYKYLDYGERGGEPFDDARYRFTGEWRFQPRWAAVTTYQTFDDFNLMEWTLGIRAYFDTKHDRPRKRAPAAGG